MGDHKQSCLHPIDQHQYSSKNKSAYCLLCGSLLYYPNTQSDDNTTSSPSPTKECYSFCKPSHFEKRTEIDPIELLSDIYLKQPHPIPPTISAWYLKNRKRAISYLQKIILLYKYSDSSLYLALYYVDILMNTGNDLAKSKFELIIISSMLLASKFIENITVDPNLSRLIDSNSYYNEDDIIKSELIYLRKLEYKLNRFGPYDILMYLLNNGFVFKREIKYKPKEFINIIYCYAKKTFTDFVYHHDSLNYSPVQIAFSVIHLTRKRFDLKPQNFKGIRGMYDYHYTSYKECLGVMKAIIEQNEATMQSNSTNTPSVSPSKSIRSEVSKPGISPATNRKKTRLFVSKSYLSLKSRLLKVSRLFHQEEEGIVNVSNSTVAKNPKSSKQLIVKGINDSAYTNLIEIINM